MNIDEKIAELKASIESCERVCEAVPTGTIRDAALRKANDCKQMVEWLEGYKRLSSSEKANKWIPASEEIPKESGYYLTSTIYNEVYCDYWNGIAFDRSEVVIAWCRLPLPYRAESEESDGNTEIHN